MEIDYEMIGKRLRSRRKELQIKQADMAEFLDISNNHMSSIENGRQKPGLEVLLQICIYLKVTPDYILLGNMHADDVPQDIMDGLRLCRTSDLVLCRDFIELLIERNQEHWNTTNNSNL